jgi:hypothetical protein
LLRSSQTKGQTSYMHKPNRTMLIFLTTKHTKITKKSREIILNTFLRALRGELLTKVRPKGAKFNLQVG